MELILEVKILEEHINYEFLNIISLKAYNFFYEHEESTPIERRVTFKFLFNFFYIFLVLCVFFTEQSYCRILDQLISFPAIMKIASSCVTFRCNYLCLLHSMKQSIGHASFVFLFIKKGNEIPLCFRHETRRVALRNSEEFQVLTKN